MDKSLRPQSAYSNVVALTGRSGSGKSTVANILDKLGAKIVSADKLAHLLLNNDPDTILEVKNTFPELANKIDKKILSRLIFNTDNPQISKANKIKLEKILHPRIKELAKKEFVRISSDFKSPIIVYDVPLLFETDLYKENFLAKVLVTSNNSIERIVNRDKITKLEAEQRISNQLPDEYKRDKVDYILENNSSLKELEEKSFNLYEELKEKLEKL